LIFGSIKKAAIRAESRAVARQIAPYGDGLYTGVEAADIRETPAPDGARIATLSGHLPVDFLTI